MRKDGVVLVVICLVVMAATLVWWLRSSTSLFTAPLESQVQDSDTVVDPAPPVVKAVPKPKAALQPIAEPPVVVEAPPSPVPPPVVTVVQHDPPPFPAVEQIAAGAHEDSVTRKFGDPALSAMTSTGGHVVETLVYAKERGRSATVIRLEDGKVSSAYSQSEPVLPSGLSAPRRWHNE